MLNQNKDFSCLSIFFSPSDASSEKHVQPFTWQLPLNGAVISANDVSISSIQRSLNLPITHERRSLNAHYSRLIFIHHFSYSPHIIYTVPKWQLNQNESCFRRIKAHFFSPFTINCAHRYWIISALLFISRTLFTGKKCQNVEKTIWKLLWIFHVRSCSSSNWSCFE